MLREKNAPASGRTRSRRRPTEGPCGELYLFSRAPALPGVHPHGKMLKEVTEEAFAEEMKSGLVGCFAPSTSRISPTWISGRALLGHRAPSGYSGRGRRPERPWQEMKRVPGDKAALRQALEALVRPMLARRPGGS